MSESARLNPFDSVATLYDDVFTNSAIGKLQRKRVHHFLKKYLSNSRKLEILEINCGTGEDALWLKSMGHDVLATDASAKMIEMANAKNKMPGLTFEVCTFDNSINKFQDRQFDMIFSNFGGLNCIDGYEMKKNSEHFSYLLKPKGKLIAVVMGRKCVWEAIYFALKLNFKNIRRRQNEMETLVKVGNYFQKTFYYSPKELTSHFSKNFHLGSKSPVGIALPPSYLEPFFKNKYWLLRILYIKECLLPFSFFSNYADHYFAVLEKK